MSVRARRRIVSLALVAGFAILSSPLPATSSPLQPSEKVYVTSVNNKILEVDFDAGLTRVVVSDNGSSFQGLVVRDDLFLIVADNNQAGKVKIFNLGGQGTTITGLIRFPSGVTLDGDQNLFVSNQHPGRTNELWRVKRDTTDCPESVPNPLTCLNGGYLTAERMAAPVLVGGAASRVLADVKAAEGELWVLVQNPPALVRYANPLTCPANSCPGTPAIAQGFFQGLTPTGLAFTGPEILVSTAEGPILRFDLALAKNGNAGDDASPGDFADVGGRAERIAVGLQGGEARAFVTVHPKTVLRFGILGGVGTPLVGNVNSPVGVSLASANAAVTSLGAPVVRCASVEASFEGVTLAGLSDCACFSIPDPREGSGPGACDDGVGNGQPLQCDLRLNDPNAGLPPAIVALNFPNVIPRYVRGFKLTSDAAQGVLRLCIAKTTSGFEDLIGVHGDREEFWLGYDPSCLGTVPHGGGAPVSPDPTMRPRFFLSEEPPFDALHEGLVFINNTSLCGSDGADAWNMNSLWLTGVRETRPADNTDPGFKVADAAPAGPGFCVDSAGVAECQLNRLRDVLTTCAAADGAFGDMFDNLATGIIPRFDAGQDVAAAYCDAKAGLVTFEAAVASAADVIFADCPKLRAELRGRAKAAIFTIDKDLCTP